MTKKRKICKIGIRIHYSCEEIARVKLSKTRPPLLVSPTGRAAIICISGLLVTSSNQGKTATLNNAIVNLLYGDEFVSFEFSFFFVGKRVRRRL